MYKIIFQKVSKAATGQLCELLRRQNILLWVILMHTWYIKIDSVNQKI